jgi:hypothetical protein
LHPELEGFAVPIEPNVDDRWPQRIRGHFSGNGSKYAGWCCEGIDEETARFLDNQFLTIDSAFERVRVDRDRLAESYEAWIWVRGVLSAQSVRAGENPKTTEFRGVLTWPNSD